MNASEINRPKVGLVLSGGGAKGFAHIGALKILDSLNIQIDFIVGTSFGAIAGAMYSIGYSGDEIEIVANETDWEAMFTDQVSRRNLPYFEKKDYKKYQLEFRLNKLKPIQPDGFIQGQNALLELNKIFFEIIMSKGFKKEALIILKKRKNIRLIDFNKHNFIEKKSYNFLGNSFLLQDLDNLLLDKNLRIVTKKKPSKNQMQSLKFAFNICKFVKSNAIVIVNDKSTIGIGSGQPSRLDSCKIAAGKALEFLPEKLINSVAASDAFFPFPDGIEQLIESGVKAVIQPGGSINDKKAIKVANDAGIIMAFTGTRHFKH